MTDRSIRPSPLVLAIAEEMRNPTEAQKAAFVDAVQREDVLELIHQVEALTKINARLLEERNEYAARRREALAQVEPLRAEVLRLQQGAIQMLIWNEPENSNYAIRYILLPADLVGCQQLVVTGDLGDAVYAWYGHRDRPLTLSGIAGFRLSYFASKCVASETGIGFRDWDEATADAYLLERVEEWEQDDTVEDRSPDAIAMAAEVRRGLGIGSPAEMDDWFRTTAGVEEVFGQDTWEMADCGYRPHDRCAMHLECLQAALAQLAAAGPRKGNGDV